MDRTALDRAYRGWCVVKNVVVPWSLAALAVAWCASCGTSDAPAEGAELDSDPVQEREANARPGDANNSVTPGPPDGPESPTNNSTEEPTEPVEPAPDNNTREPVEDPIEPDPVSEPCLAMEGCFDTFPQTIVDSTVGGERARDSYSCAPDTNESGPERVYRVVLSEPGFLAARIDNPPDGVDVDVHILSEDDTGACIDRGHITAGALLDAGEYVLIADTWVDEAGTEYAGDFELSVNVTTAASLVAFGIRDEVAKDALDAFTKAWQLEDTNRFEYAITDFSIHSSSKRAWIIDFATGALLFNMHIGHGIKSVEGEDLGAATIFSNTPASHQSSLGLMKAAEIYVGDFGYSMRLDGLEPGFNDNVRDRDIVVHPDQGVLPEIITERGWVVPSRGCPILDPAISMSIIDTLANGALMFFWYPQTEWRTGSTYLQ